MQVSTEASRGAAGGRFRFPATPGRQFVTTVAHILYDRRGRLRQQVFLDGQPARIHAIVPLPELRRIRADAALIEPARLPRDASVLAGHLHRFGPGLRVCCRLDDGRMVRGQLAGPDWAGAMAYGFGRRQLTGQWIVSLERPAGDAGAAPMRLGDSGSLWTTDDGIGVGIQAGVLRARPYEAIVTPLDTCCRLFGVRVAAGGGSATPGL